MSEETSREDLRDGHGARMAQWKNHRSTTQLPEKSERHWQPEDAATMLEVDEEPELLTTTSAGDEVVDARTTMKMTSVVMLRFKGMTQLQLHVSATVRPR
uniref:Uncharacterized protein n=1 Tax=Oryza punctata TaxID=4537 RepID=A0A0E0LCM4_ORYPU